MDSNEDDDIWDCTEGPEQTEEFVTDARKKTYNFSDNEDINNNNNDEDKPRISKNWENEENSKEQFSEHSKTNESFGGIFDEESICNKPFQTLDGLKPRSIDEFHPQEDQTSFNIRNESISHQYESSNPVDDDDYNKETSESKHTKSFLNKIQTINEKEHFSDKFSTHLSAFRIDDHESYENNFPSNETDSEDKAHSSELLTGQNHVKRGDLHQQDLSLDHKDVETFTENGDPEDFERDKKNIDQEHSGKENIHKMKIKRSEIRQKLQREQTGSKSEDGNDTEIQSGTLKKFRKRVRSVKPRVRSISDPGEERKQEAGVLYRSRSQPRIPRESRSGEFDWSTSKNDRIQSWLKEKARLLRKQRAEERKNKRMEKNEEEEKRRQRDEKFVDSAERVSEWMRQKAEQEHRMKKKRRQDPHSARTFEYSRWSPENSLSPDFVLHGVGQDRAMRSQKMPLLIQREKQQQALLRSFSKYLDHNRSVAQIDKGVDRKRSSSAKRSFEKPEEKPLRGQTDRSYLPAPPVQMHSIAKSIDQQALRQSLSLSRIIISSETEKGNAAEQVKLKKKITFEEWLKQKKADDELKSQMLRGKKLDADAKELQKSIEVEKMSLASERKSAPVIGARKTDKVSESISRFSTGGKPVRNVKLDAAELSETGRRDRGASAGIRRMIKNSDVARYSYSAFARNPQTNGGMDMHGGRAFGAKSPKPEAAMRRPQSSAGRIQRNQKDGFSKYVWNHVKEQEGSMLTITSRDKMRLRSSGSEACKPEHNLEMRKGENDEMRKEKLISNESCDNGRKDPENRNAWKLDKAESDIHTIIDGDDEEVDAGVNQKLKSSDPEIISVGKTFFGKQISTEPADYESPTNTISSYPAMRNGSNSGDLEVAFGSDFEVGGSEHSELSL